MEMCGIILAVPAAFVLAVGYSTLLAWFMPDDGIMRRFFWVASVAILELFAVELVLLRFLGAVRSREVIGPAFTIAHLACFVLSIPAFANLLVLAGRRPSRLKRFWVAGLCAAFALPLVFVQYGVMESLYGMDGESGPYSDAPRSPTIIFSPNRRPERKAIDNGPDIPKPIRE